MYKVDLSDLIKGGFGIVAVVGMWAVGIALLIFVGKHLETIFGWTQGIAELTVVVCILVLAPLGLFRKTRAISATGYVIASYVFGANLFIFGVIVVLSLWGIVALIIGLVFVGVGVVPVAFLASIFRREWSVFWQLVLGVAFTWGARAYGIYLGMKAEREQAQYAVPAAIDEIVVEKEPKDVSNSEDIF